MKSNDLRKRGEERKLPVFLSLLRCSVFQVYLNRVICNQKGISNE